MREIRASMRLVGLILVAAIVAATALFAVTVRVRGARWINLAYNSRLADAKKTTVQGAVTDKTGTVLSFSPAPGVRSYIADEDTRRALSHTLGDQRNMSETGVENLHASTLLGITDTRTGYTLRRLAGYDPVGNNIALTVNAELTRSLAEAFPDEMSGAAVMINYKTGAILAMVSFPNYDPANIGVWDADTAYFNRALRYGYAPGSTFKIVTLTAALESVQGVESEIFNCPGVWNYAGNSLRCASNAAHGDISLQEAFAKSCNVTFGSLAYNIGAPSLRETAERFGFNFDFSFDDVILYESKCLTGDPDNNELIQTGIGQSKTQATPLHMAMIAGAIANGGEMMAPKLIFNVTNPAGAVLKSMEPELFRVVASREHCETVARYMYEAVKNGTATRAAVQNYAGYVCGKTGSAEWTDDKGAPTNAWYVGFLYGDDSHPYAIAVVVEKGGSGGTVAAPVAAKAFERAIALGVY